MIQRENLVPTHGGPVEVALAEYFTRVDRGERVDLTQLIAAYPGCEAGLRRFLNKERQLKLAVVETPSAATSSEHLAGRTLGDYRILRELGRGGMGVVYEAEQLSLGRRVALKVLPFGAMLGNQQLVRFKNEARAAATLEHPNIVAIYSVGSDGDVHYYAMQLIEGHSLAQVIATMQREQRSSLPRAEASPENAALSTDAQQFTTDFTQSAPPSAPAQPPSTSDTAPIAHLTTLEAPCNTLPASSSREFYRTVARLGIQAAEALDHAHRNGILHRDIKPGNLLLDSSGKLYVTDFGLARIEADVGMTMTGDIIGTLRYMAPEQALAKRVVVDHRSDIYSLGATLYELLTLRPTFTGDNRPELLRQIAFDDPTPLRQIDRRIPIELETIVLKALRKDAKQRYATAQDLADDFQRFLDDQPILAKPPTWRERVIKWSRRHVALVWSAAVAIVAISIVLAVSTVLISGALMNTKTALTRADTERDAANNARDAVARERDAGDQKLYVAQMRLAKENWDRGDVARMQDLLEEHLPRPGRPDLRGWEWYYLHSLPAQSELVYRGHFDGKNEVRAVAWSPDGHQIASTSFNSKLRQCVVKIWNPENGNEICTLHNPEWNGSWVRSLAWSPDGERLATTGLSGQVHIMDVIAGKTLATIDTDNGVHSWRVSWSPDGKRLVSPGSDQTVVIWDTTTGEAQKRLSGHPSPVRIAVWSPDGQSVAATGYEPGSITVWNVESGSVKKVLATGDLNWITALNWSPDSSRIASGDLMDATVKVWDLATGNQLLSLPHGGAVGDLEFSPSGQQLATSVRGNRITIWNARSGDVERTIQGHDRQVNSIAWSPDGKRLISGAGDGLAKIWNVERVDTHLPFNDDVLPALIWSPDDLRIAYGSTNQSVVVCDAITGKRVHLLEGHENLVLESLQWNSDGRLLACGGRKGTIRVWDAESGTTLHTWTHVGARPVEWQQYDQWASIAWHPNGRQVASVCTIDNVVRIWDARSAQLIDSFERENANDKVAWSPDGERLVTVDKSDRLVQIWDAAGWKRLHAVQLPRVYVVAWSPDGRFIATGGSDELPTQVFDTVTGRAVRAFHGHTGQVQGMTWSSDSRRLMSCGHNETILWDAITGDQLLILEGRGSAAWSHDQKKIAVISNRRIRIYDATMGYERAVDQNHLQYRAREHYRRALELTTVGNYAQAMSQINLSLQLAPNDTSTQISATWFLANCSNQRIRDPLRALKLAKSATEASPDSDVAWQVLGWARYRTGDWTGSVEALKRSVELQRDGGDPWQWFFLAMAEWHLGNRDAARVWYTKAIDWVQQYPHNQREELHRFRAEAEELLGKPEPVGQQN